MDRPVNLNFKCCSFCPIEKHELYKCPQCSTYYCSLRCFRSNKHLKCSEEFYRKQCAEHLEFSAATSETKPGIKGKEAIITTFEQYMAQHEQNSNEKIAEDKANPQIAVNANEEILFDSDDEPEYLSKMVSSTLEQFHSTDDEELNRRILSAGLPMPLGSETFSTGEDSQEQMEHLYQKLTTEEKRKFTELADEMFRDDLQLKMNCFAKKSVKK